MNRQPYHDQKQCGSAMLMALFILVILTLVGLLAARSTTTELHMATNEMRQNQAFYAAEGVGELISEIIEQNIACPNGFTENRVRGGLVQVHTPAFWKNKPQPGIIPSDGDGDAPPVRDMRIPIGDQDNDPHTNVLIYGTRAVSRGNALQTSAGYEGIGRSMANAGTHMIYDQIVQHKTSFNTEAMVRIKWRHVIGLEGICRP